MRPLPPKRALLQMTPLETLAMRTLLEQRFENGAVHVHTREDRILLKQAKRLGFVTDEGYLTSDGAAFRKLYPSRPPARSRRLASL